MNVVSDVSGAAVATAAASDMSIAAIKQEMSNVVTMNLFKQLFSKFDPQFQGDVILLTHEWIRKLAAASEKQLAPIYFAEYTPEKIHTLSDWVPGDHFTVQLRIEWFNNILVLMNEMPEIREIIFHWADEFSGGGLAGNS